MGWQTNGSALVLHRPSQGLTDPVGGVGGKTEATLVVVLVHRMDETQCAFLDQVLHRNPAVLVLFGDRCHQTQVGVDEDLTCVLAARPTGLDQHRKMLFLSRRKQLRACPVCTLRHNVLEDAIFMLQGARRRNSTRLGIRRVAGRQGARVGMPAGACARGRVFANAFSKFGRHL